MIPAVSNSPSIDQARLQSETRVIRHLRELFTRLPMLAGFQLRSDFMVTGVSAVGGSSCASIGRLRVNVMQALVELAECDSDAIVLMRGRTFARHTTAGT